MSSSILRQIVQNVPFLTRKLVRKQSEFSTTISELLESTGMTQRELADKLGKQESYVSKMLSGWSNPTLKTIVEFEVALGVDIIEFKIKPNKHQIASFIFETAYGIQNKLNTEQQNLISISPIKVETEPYLKFVDCTPSAA
ncbi:MAG: helix-turn-helix transcriptional regulator [Chlorobiaceae bacterium]|nr:helix-turn-helix transcriptional regulator [Chlorobiaceae bacterium]